MAGQSGVADRFFFIGMPPSLCFGRGKGKAMTQKTISLLWWASYHLSWADHVFKVVSVLPIFRDITGYDNAVVPMSS